MCVSKTILLNFYIITAQQFDRREKLNEYQLFENCELVTDEKNPDRP